MEPVITNLDHLAPDDIAGAVFLYGYRITSDLEPYGVVVGQTFSYQITANNNPTRYSATGLPAGLYLDPATGTITGACTQGGTFAVTITAYGAAKNVTAVLTLNVAVAQVYYDPAYVDSFEVGTPGSFTVKGPNSPTNFTATDLPPGLTINTTTGVVSGIPTLSGTYSSSFIAHGPQYDAGGTITLQVNSRYQDIATTLSLQGSVVKMIPDPARSLLYVLDSYGVEVIDCASLTVIKSVRVINPTDMTLSSDNTALWLIVDPFIVSGYSLPDLSPLPAIPNGPFYGFAVRAGVNKKLYLQYYNQLFQLDTTTGTLVQVGAQSSIGLAFSMDVSPDHRYLYLAYQERYPGVIARYDITGATPVLVGQRTGLGWVLDPEVLADGKTVIYKDNELTKAVHLFALSTSNLGAANRPRDLGRRLPILPMDAQLPGQYHLRTNSGRT